MNLPKSWADVTIEQYYKIATIDSIYKDPLDKEINLISCLSNSPIKEAEKMTKKDLIKCMEQLKFLNELPETKNKLMSSFKHRGKVYQACLLSTGMEAGQFIDFSSIGKNATDDELPYHMHELIAAMCKTRKGHFWNYTWDYEGYTNTMDDLIDLPMSIAYPYYVFFCNVLMNLRKPILDYSLQQAKKEVKRANKIIK